MKKISTLLFCCIYYAASAQPTINSTVVPGAGINITDIMVDATTLQPGNAGANQTWNFAGVTPTGTTLLRNYIMPAGTPYGANFPAATICERAPDGAGGFTYAYMVHNSSMTDFIGFGLTINGQNVPIIYSNPQTFLQYPANYNSTMSDVFAGSYTYMAGPYTANDYRTGTYNYVADAYGTMTSPAGTFTNSLRLKIRQYVHDSIVFVGIPVTSISNFYSTTYNWLCANPPNKMNQFYLSFDTTITTSTTTSKSAYYQGVVTGIEEQAPYETAYAEVYPNPASDYAFFVLNDSENGTAEINLYDLTGKLAMNTSTKMTAAGRFEWMFPIQQLPPGLYHARITCNEKQWQTKLLKN